VQLEIGELLQAQKDFDGALVAYQRAIAVRPNLVEAHSGIGEIQLEKQDFLGAITTFRRVIELDRDRAEAYYNMGKALKAGDRKSEAIEAFQQALDTYRQQGNNDGAEKAEAALQELK
jgi:tetratricopeptide (TPR) repeat protein